MIYVKEINPPIKMSGLSSFIITPETNSNLVYDIISRLTVNRYDPKTTRKAPYYYLERDGFWEISSVDIRSFLEQATKIDDIHLELIENDVKKPFEEVSDRKQDNLTKAQYKPVKHSSHSEFPDWLKRFIDLH